MAPIGPKDPMKVVDLVVYTPEGRKVVGKAEFDENENEVVVTAIVTDPEVAKKLSPPHDLDHFSVGEHGVPSREPLKRHNVFDIGEKDKA